MVTAVTPWQFEVLEAGARMAVQIPADVSVGARSSGPSVLVVDDDVRVRTVVCWQLDAEGYTVNEAADGTTAWQRIVETRPDLIVLDLSLPGMSGLDLLRRLRDMDDGVPVVVLSGRAGEGDRILGLDVSADDYLVKPFSLGELAARVRSVLRRSSGRAVERPSAELSSNLHIDPWARKVELDGDPVQLTAREFDLLSFFAAHPGQVFSRAQLLEHVWASSKRWQGEATVTEHVHRLRHKIGSRHLETVRGVGYRFEP